ncbi:unnamed protein product [Litomosoides sigmodontis]|uniref:PDZ domain-containing protein n=1 Tax=Litomosoides sigmodontis TaxID=42156 RepID=A0A3P6SPY2_LITSI|nr:unnamed protein product [Litomosoides sigmodontis]
MPLYPTLEDLLVDQYQYQQNSGRSGHDALPFRSFVEPSAPVYESNSSVPGRIYEAIDENSISPASPEALQYPSLPSYESIAKPSLLKPSPQLPEIATMRLSYPHLPQSANLTHGIRKVILSRIKGKKYGLRMQAVNQGIFVQFVAEGSPASAAGIRFGDQLLQLNDIEVLGMTGQKVMNIMKKSKYEIILMLRDRPLARTITLHKDSAGLLGFSFKDNLITAVMQGTSASRNGLLINQRIVEIDGRNVMAFKNKAMKSCLDDAPMTVTLTLMPADFYDEITKKSVETEQISLMLDLVKFFPGTVRLVKDFCAAVKDPNDVQMIKRQKHDILYHV